MNVQTMLAIFKRDFRSYFVSLTGYIFIVAFVVVATLMALRPHTGEFFTSNKANLDMLSYEWCFPVLLVIFAPAVTMAAWAQERERGTDNLLLTLPAQDHEIVLAKYFACLGVYTVSLLFTLPLVGALAYLGQPDMGLILSTYFGYWLMGAAAVAVAMLGSALVKNMTQAWLLGSILCVFAASPGWLVNNLIKTTLVRIDVIDSVASESSAVLGFMDHFNTFARYEAFTRGVVVLEDVVYFLGLIVIALYANSYVLGRRHWTTVRSKAVHGGARLAALAVAFGCLIILSERAVARADLTEEQLLSLSPTTQSVLSKLEEKNEKGAYKHAEVFIQAWISPEVPAAYEQTREDLIRTLEEFEARGGDRLRVAIYDTEMFSEEAQQAETTFEIKSSTVEDTAQSTSTTTDIFLGLAFTCGTRQVTIPFFYKGLPVQYELTRAIASLLDLDRKRVGVLKTQIDMAGSFDFQSMNRSSDWELLADLRKQYKVEKIVPDKDIAIRAKDAKGKGGVDALVVPLPSSMQQPEMDRLAKYLYHGGNALLLCDSYPQFDPQKAASLGPPRQNPFQRRKAPPKPKGNVKALLGLLGLTWHTERVVWDAYNPHPRYERIPPQYVFVGPTDPDAPADSPATGFGDHPISKGLQEIVMIFSGELQPGTHEGLKITPLLSTRTTSGYHVFKDMIQESFMGMRPLPPEALELLEYKSLDEPRILAVAIEGLLRRPPGKAAASWGDAKPFRAVVVADMDMVSDLFYRLRRGGNVDFSLDNVTFVANAIDWLAGSEELVELRKRRPRHRTLTRMEKIKREQEKEQAQAIKDAREAAKKKLEGAKERLDKAIEKIKKDATLDDRTKDIRIREVSTREQKVFDQAKRRIEDEKKATIRKGESETKQNVKAIEWSVIYVLVILSTLPALLLGLLVFYRKRRVEQASMDPDRKRSAA